MKLLYIYDPRPSMSGGAVVSKRNLESLQEVCGKENVFVYAVPQEDTSEKIPYFIKRAQTVLQGYIIHHLKFILNDIFHLIKKEKITTVFLDSSLLGIVSKKIKKRFPKIKIITFFHNIETQYYFSELLIYKDIFHSYLLPLQYRSERLACKYSDELIVLNQRDAELLKRIYHKTATATIPVSVKNDEFVNKSDYVKEPDQPFTMIFVGSLFYANEHGIKWFAKNVMPLFPQVRLEIVGRNMNQIAADIESTNIKVYSDVTSLYDFYRKADLVILPIFNGGGMKVKTAESLMYAKTIVGTQESFIGYEYMPEIGKICSNKQEFCEAIEYYLKHTPPLHNEDAKRLYEQKYSFEATLNQFKQII